MQMENTPIAVDHQFSFLLHNIKVRNKFKKFFRPG
jgi:hypothetical protein